jgi:SAM-dependent methyltransferase
VPPALTLCGAARTREAGMDSLGDWWTPFFQGPFLDVQVDYGPAEKTRAEVDALEPLLALGTPARVLDAPCGTGRHSLELARRGHRVTGIDFNPRVLEVGREQARAGGLDIDFQQADLRQLEFESCFDAALCHWGSFGYFTEPENADFLGRVGRALRPGGRFFLDTPLAETLFPQSLPCAIFYVGEGPRRLRVLEERHFDHESGRIESQWTFQRDGREESRTMSMRIYSYRELVALMRGAGMHVVSATDRDGKAFSFGCNRLWLTVEKS